MTTQEFFNEFVHPRCHKVEHRLSEYITVRGLPHVRLIKATTFYQIYKHNVFGEDGHRLTLSEFFRVCGQYLYYDKYVCTHGTEFYYYVDLNPENLIVQATMDIINRRIEASSPKTLTDLEYVVEAIHPNGTLY